MKSRLRIDSPNLAYSFGSVLLVGAATSGLLTKDTRWMNWHFSRLGEGGTISSIIFNITLLISAAVMFALGLALIENISQIPDTVSINVNRAKTIISRAFNAVTVCLVGVAIFPFDRFPVIHNIFGYSMLFIFLALCIMMPKILPIFSKQFYIYSRLVILCAIICYTLFLAVKVMTLLAVEFVMFTSLYAWLLFLISGIRKSYRL
jgi:hypothetical membrane protein